MSAVTIQIDKLTTFAIGKSDEMLRLRPFHVFVLSILVVILGSCSSVKHVPQGQHLVDNVKITVEDTDDVTSSDLYNYLRQTPTHKVLGFAKIQLATYSLSGRDSSRWYNRWLQRLGQAPVIYDQSLTEASTRQLQQAMINKGYMDATVTVDTVRRDKKKKINVYYTVHAGTPHTISSIDYNIPDSTISKFVMRDSARFTVKEGDLLDRNNLDAERTSITNRLHNRGYYSFTKEYITFTADTVSGEKNVDLTLNILPPKDASGNIDTLQSHQRYYIRNVIFVTNYDPGDIISDYKFNATDTVHYNQITVLYGKDHYIRPQVLDENCHIIPGEMYQAHQIDRTYESLGRLGIIKSVNISVRQVAEIDGKKMLDTYILLNRGRKQGVTFELEGTNSEGDLGFGVGVTYQHRNLARGSELLTTKFRTSYESISGDLDGLINDRYTEYAGEIGITFPKFMAPFLSRRFKQRMKASTEFAVSFNYQERPEYTRIIAGGAWKYKWVNRNNTVRRTLDFIDVNYVYLPHSTINFIDQIAPDNPLLRYSYEDHFIMRIGYTYSRTNKRIATSALTRYRLQPNVYTLRASIETAGNLLYAFSSLSDQQREFGSYKIFGIQYSQYVKGEVDYTLIHNLNSRNTLAFHVGAGIGVPYANSSMMPFEKRFYAGGANGVRGWSVRTLGPGRYNSKNSITDFINQCGDIRLDLSFEYRARLFWVVEGALFVDAGNIWTIKPYENQKGGMFHFNEFYKEIAAAYGAGIRLDFSYFLLRFDLGMKAYNPAFDQERWPIAHPNWKRDATFHFSVGYPF